MDRLTQWIGRGDDRRAIPNQENRKVGHTACLIKLAKYEDEAERREHGCVYCRTGNLTVTHSIDGQDVAISHEVLYCPVCGRELEG